MSNPPFTLYLCTMHLVLRVDVLYLVISEMRKLKGSRVYLNDGKRCFIEFTLFLERKFFLGKKFKKFKESGQTRSPLIVFCIHIHVAYNATFFIYTVKTQWKNKCKNKITIKMRVLFVEIKNKIYIVIKIHKKMRVSKRWHWDTCTRWLARRCRLECTWRRARSAASVCWCPGFRRIL